MDASRGTGIGGARIAFKGNGDGRSRQREPPTRQSQPQALTSPDACHAPRACGAPLETARAFGIAIDPRGHEEISGEVDFIPYRAKSAEQLVSAWVPLSLAINAIQRSMGQPDSYPFVLSSPVVAKLEYLHRLIQGAAVARQ